jgi:hypothetical protein
MSSNDYTATNNNNNNNNADTSMTVDDDDNNDDDAETETETDRILSLLKEVVGSATKEFPTTTSSAEQGERKQYEKCLLSFKATTYFSKPTCLSPMFCSRFGYVPAASATTTTFVLYFVFVIQWKT